MRNKVLDIMKGIGIILVILIHSLDSSLFKELKINSQLDGVIYVFFMALFFICSGFIIYGKICDDKLKWSFNKIIKFITPIFSTVILLYMGVHLISWNYLRHNEILMSSFNKYLFANVFDGFGTLVWFLWTLLLCYLITVFAEGFKKGKYSLLIIVVLMTVLNLVPFYAYGLKNVAWYGIFFFIGYYISKYKIQLMRFEKFTIIGALTFIPVLALFFNWGISRSDSYVLLFSGWTPYITGIGLGLMGTSLIYWISKLLSKIKIVSNIFSYLGISSIGIYLLHPYFIGFLNNYWVSTLVALGCAVILYEILKRFKWTNFILFGGSNMPESITNRVFNNFVIENGKIYFRKVKNVKVVV